MRTYSRRRRLEPLVEVDILIKVEEVKQEVQEEEVEVKQDDVEVEDKQPCLEKVEVKEEIMVGVKCEVMEMKIEVGGEIEVKEEVIGVEDERVVVKNELFEDSPDEDEEAFSDEEQVDARKLYPRRRTDGDEEGEEEEEGKEEMEEEFQDKVVKSIEIMEVSCFGHMDNEEEGDGEEEWRGSQMEGKKEERMRREERLGCRACRRHFTHRRGLAR